MCTPETRHSEIHVKIPNEISPSLLFFRYNQYSTNIPILLHVTFAVANHKEGFKTPTCSKLQLTPPPQELTSTV